MLVQQNTTTARLEAFGRGMGLKYPSILKSPNNAAGVFFLVALDGITFSRWVPLGWTREDAKRRLEEFAREQ